MAGSRKEVVGLPVVPAAVSPPHVAHQELRVVVDGPQIRLVPQVGRHLDLVERPVQRAAGVHQRQRLPLDGLQHLGGVEQGLADPVGAEDRQPVAREHDLGVQARHPPQRRGPLPGVALHLLRVAGVGEGPDEQVAGVQDPPLGDPRPGGVVGLTQPVVELERDITAAEGQLVLVGHVRIPEVGRELPSRHRQAELALVDGRVPPPRALVAPEVGRHGLVAVHHRRLPALVRWPPPRTAWSRRRGRCGGGRRRRRPIARYPRHPASRPARHRRCAGRRRARRCRA